MVPFPWDKYDSKAYTICFSRTSLEAQEWTLIYWQQISLDCLDNIAFGEIAFGNLKIKTLNSYSGLKSYQGFW